MAASLIANGGFPPTHTVCPPRAQSSFPKADRPLSGGKADGQKTPNRCHRLPTAQFLIADVCSTMHLCGMQHASIVAFLSGKLSPEALAEEIAAEVAAFREALRLTATGHFIVSDGPKFLITKEAARRLLEAVADERLPFNSANYVSDCIVMNDDFEFADDATRDAIHYIEDDSGRFVAQDDNWHPPREETLAAIALLD